MILIVAVSFMPHSDVPEEAPAGNAAGSGMTASVLADRGVALWPDDPSGLLPQFPGRRVEGMAETVDALHMPPGGILAVVAPEAFQPLVVQRHYVAERGKEFIGLPPAQAPEHQLADVGEVEVMLPRNADQLLFRMARTEQLPPAWSPAGARWPFAAV